MKKIIGQEYDNKHCSYFSAKRNDVLPFIPENCKKLLDVGCGAGEFGALIKARSNAEIWGVDLNAQAIEKAKNNLDHAFLAPFSTEIELPDRYFDVITFNDSLEHFPDPYPPLELCKKKLAAGGIVVCVIPNVRYYENVKHFLIEMDWKYEDSGILDVTHLKFFTKKSMLRTFDIADYEVLSITGIRPHYWSGKTIFILRMLFGKYMEDMKYLNYVLIAKPKK